MITEQRKRYQMWLPGRNGRTYDRDNSVNTEAELVVRVPKRQRDEKWERRQGDMGWKNTGMFWKEVKKVRKGDSVKQIREGYRWNSVD